MGISPDSSEELATLYASFTEGFDEDQLKVARQLLAI
jgi:hypothetical protein